MYESDFYDVGVSAADYKPAGGMRHLSSKEIFRALIAQEVRTGRLTPNRRRRIVRYAAQLHLSAVEAGRMIAECRDEALESDNFDEVYHALRLVEPPPAEMPAVLKVAIALAGAVVVNFLLSSWL